MSKKARCLTVMLCAVTAFALLWFLGRLTQPKYMDTVPEGALIAEYYRETQPHQVIFIGDCEVYENFSPLSMWEECGITSYVRGSAQQLIWQSYALLEETFATEQPELVVYNVQAMHYGEPQSEAYNRMTLDGMRLSRYKLDGITASMTEEESLLSYLLPVMRYHSRLFELTDSDFRYLFRREPVSVAGYLPQTGVAPMIRLPSVPMLEDPALPEICFAYLEKLQTLCEANGARLVLIKSSSLWPHWYDEWDEQIAAFAASHSLDYINLIPAQEEIGLDFTTDTYDGGLHLNTSGADKLSRYFAHVLQDTYGIADLRSDSALAADWAQKKLLYAALTQE